MTWKLPEKDHPIWKIAQSLIGLAGMYIFLSNENNGVSPHEMVGIISGAVFGKLGFQGFQIYKNGKGDS